MYQAKIGMNLSKGWGVGKPGTSFDEGLPPSRGKSKGSKLHEG